MARNKYQTQAKLLTIQGISVIIETVFNRSSTPNAVTTIGRDMTTPLFNNTTAYCDLTVIIGLLEKTKLSGKLHLRTTSFAACLYFHEGKCFFASPREIDDYFKEDILQDLTFASAYREDIREFIKYHPQFVLEAFKASGVDADMLLTRSQEVSKRTIFSALLQAELTYEFGSMDAFSEGIFQDKKLRELLLMNKGTCYAVVDLAFLAYRLRLVPVQGEKMVGQSKVNPFQQRILSYIDGHRSVISIVREFSDFDPFAVFMEFHELELPGRIIFEVKSSHALHLASPETMRLIDSTIEIFKGIIPILFNNIPEQVSTVSNLLVSQTMNELRIIDPLLFLGILEFHDNHEFFSKIQDRLEEIEAEEKVMVMKRGLFTFFITLLTHLYQYRGDSFHTVETKIKGFLSFILKVGTTEQKELGQAIMDTFTVMNSIVPFFSRCELDDEPVYPQLEMLMQQQRYGEVLDYVESLANRLDCALYADIFEQAKVKALAHFKILVGEEHTLIERSPLNPERLNLESRDQEAIISRLDSPITISELIADTELPPANLYRLLWSMMEKKIIRVAERVQPWATNENNQESRSFESSPAPVSSDTPGRSDSVVESNYLLEQESPQSAGGQEILKNLKLEYYELTAHEPFELFGLTPRFTREELEEAYQTLRAKYSISNYPVQTRELVIPVLDRIQATLDRAQDTLMKYIQIAESPPDPGSDLDSFLLEDIETEQELLTNDPTSPEAHLHDPRTDQPLAPRGQKNLKHSSVEEDSLKSRRQTEAQQLFQAAIKAKDAGDFETAVDYLQKAIQLTPQNYAFHSALENVKSAQSHKKASDLLLAARMKSRAGEFAAAVKLMKLSLSIDASMMDILLELAHLLAEKLNKPEEAVIYCRQALEKEPGNSDIHTFLGRLYKASGLLKEAREAFLEALRWNKKNVEAQKELNLLP